MLLLTAGAWAQANGPFAQFPSYMSEHFDYATFTRFDAPAPPKTLIYQSNGFLALQENGFGGQKVMIPVSGPPAPTNETERLFAMGIDAPVLIDAQQHAYRFADSAARRDMTYFADRTVYRAQFEGGPQVSLTVYPVYGKPAAVLRIKVDHATGPLDVVIASHDDGFERISAPGSPDAPFGSSKWPYRILLSGKMAPNSGSFHWKLKSGDEAALIVVLGGDEQRAQTTLAQVRSSSDLLDSATHEQWNKYLSSVPLVAPADPIQFTIGTTGQHESITPVELVRSELWFWRGLLNSTCQVDYPPGEHAGGSVRIMGYDVLDTMLFPEVAGLRTWGGNDLIVAPGAAPQKVYVRGQKWMGDRYDAIFEPGRPTQIRRNGQPLPSLASDRLWRASRDGQRVSFAPLQVPAASEAQR